jgi:hypothetical protein
MLSVAACCSVRTSRSPVFGETAMAMMRPTKATPMFAMAALVAATMLAAAQDFQVQSVVAIDGKVDCLAYMKGVTPPANPCARRLLRSR